MPTPPSAPLPAIRRRAKATPKPPTPKKRRVKTRRPPQHPLSGGHLGSRDLGSREQDTFECPEWVYHRIEIAIHGHIVNAQNAALLGSCLLDGWEPYAVSTRPPSDFDEPHQVTLTPSIALSVSVVEIHHLRKQVSK